MELHLGDVYLVDGNHGDWQTDEVSLKRKLDSQHYIMVGCLVCVSSFIESKRHQKVLSVGFQVMFFFAARSKHDGSDVCFLTPLSPGVPEQQVHEPLHIPGHAQHPHHHRGPGELRSATRGRRAQLLQGHPGAELHHVPAHPQRPASGGQPVQPDHPSVHFKHTHTHANIHAHTHTSTHTHTHPHTHTQAPTHTHTQAPTHTHTQAHMRACTHTNTAHTHICMDAPTQTHKFDHTVYIWIYLVMLYMFWSLCPVCRFPLLCVSGVLGDQHAGVHDADPRGQGWLFYSLYPHQKSNNNNNNDSNDIKAQRRQRCGGRGGR